jgi:EmrB/QacA subfamily drug resistance transporter
VVTVDSTVVNVALPAIADDLGGGLAGQQWTSNAYLLTLSSLILIGGSLGDIFGERRMFMLGVGGFGVTSLFCALAPTIELLVIARALQGVFGALLTPAALATIVATFPPDERGRAVGTWTAWGGIGTVLGPLIGGQLVDTASWRWIFAINIPVVMITLFLVTQVMAGGRPRRADARIDYVGAALCAGGLAGITYGLIEQPRNGWASTGVWLPLAAGALLFASFIVWEWRSSNPMLPLSLFRRRNFAIGNVETFSMYAGLGLLFFFLVLYLQQVAGYTAVEAGTTTLPVTATMFLLSGRFGALADRVGPRGLMGAGPLVGGAGLIWMGRIGADVDYAAQLLPAVLVFGLGLAMTVAPLTSTVLGAVEPRYAGVASGANNAIARVATLLAIAGVGAVVAASYAAALDEERRPVPAAARERPLSGGAAAPASVAAFSHGMLVGGLLVMVGGAVSLVGIVQPRRA